MSARNGNWGVKVRVWVERDGRAVLGPGRVELLEHIARQSSISAAAKQMKMSYRRAWELVRDMNEVAGVPLVVASSGGPGGGGAALTPEGLEAVRLYRALLARFASTVESVELHADPLAAHSATG